MRSLSEASNYASAIASLIKTGHSKNPILGQRPLGNIAMQGIYSKTMDATIYTTCKFVFNISLDTLACLWFKKCLD